MTDDTELKWAGENGRGRYGVRKTTENGECVQCAGIKKKLDDKGPWSVGVHE